MILVFYDGKKRKNDKKNFLQKNDKKKLSTKK